MEKTTLEPNNWEYRAGCVELTRADGQQFRVTRGSRVRWWDWGMMHSGIVERIVETTHDTWMRGDLIVRSEEHRRTLIILPERVDAVL